MATNNSTCKNAEYLFEQQADAIEKFKLLKQQGMQQSKMIGNLQSQINKMEQHNHNLFQSLTKLKNEKTSCVAEIVALKLHETKNLYLQTQIQTLENEKIGLQDQFNTQSLDLQELKSLNRKFIDENATMKQTVENSNKEVNSLMIERQNNETEKAELKKQNDELGMEIDSSKRSNTDLEAALSDLKSDLMQQKALTNSLQTQLQKLQEEKSSLETQLCSESTEKDHLRKANEDLEIEKFFLETQNVIQKEKEDLVKENWTLINLTGNLEQEISLLKMQLTDAQSWRLNLTELEKNKEDLEQTNFGLRQQLQTLEAKIAISDQGNLADEQRNKETMSRVEELQNENVVLKQQCGEANKETSNVLVQLVDLEFKKAALDKLKDELKLKIASLKIAYEDAEKENDTMRTQLRDNENFKLVLSKQKKSLTKEFDSLKERYENCKRTRTKLEMDLQQHQKSEAALSKSNKKLQDEIATLKRGLRDGNTKSASSESSKTKEERTEINFLKNQSAHLFAKNEKLKRELQKLQTENVSLIRAIDEHKSGNSSLKEQSEESKSATIQIQKSEMEKIDGNSPPLTEFSEQQGDAAMGNHHISIKEETKVLKSEEIGLEREANDLKTEIAALQTQNYEQVCRINTLTRALEASQHAFTEEQVRGQTIAILKQNAINELKLQLEQHQYTIHKLSTELFISDHKAMMFSNIVQISQKQNRSPFPNSFSNPDEELPEDLSRMKRLKTSNDSEDLTTESPTSSLLDTKMESSSVEYKSISPEQANSTQESNSHQTQHSPNESFNSK